MSEIDDLRAMMSMLAQRIDDMEGSISSHVGIDWGAAGANYPHPNQQVATVEYAGGTMKIDESGIQALRIDTQVRPILTVVNRLYSILADAQSPEYPNARGELQGAVTADGTAIAMVYGATHDGGVSTYGRTNTNSSSVQATGVTAALVANNNDGVGQGAVELVIKTGSRYASFTNVAALFALVTSDFANLLNGMLWYRSDTDKYRVRVAGVTQNLATEAYVTANGGSPWIGLGI